MHLLLSQLRGGGEASDYLALLCSISADSAASSRDSVTEAAVPLQNIGLLVYLEVFLLQYKTKQAYVPPEQLSSVASIDPALSTPGVHIMFSDFFWFP